MIPYEFPSPEDAFFPKMVVLSINNVCDFFCPHCYYPYYVDQPWYQRHDLEEEIFRKIADEVGQHPHSALRFIGWGEPLLHPKIVEFVQYARQTAPHNPLTLITNGYWLTPDRSLALMGVGLNLIEISIDAATPERYHQERPSHHPEAFSRVEQNVKKMLRQRNQSGFKTRITVSFIVYPTQESVAEYIIFEQRWNGIADEIIRRPAHSFKGAVHLPPPPHPRPPCYGLWARCNINLWGQVSVCYNDWENEYILGDLRDSETTISNIWQGLALSQLRADQCQGIFRGICATCQDYNPNAGAIHMNRLSAGVTKGCD